MTDIKFVYFDVGGVLLLDFSGTDKWAQMKKDLGVTPDLDEQFDLLWKKYRSRICVDFDVDDLHPEIEQLLKIELNDYSMLADFVNRFDPNQSIWEVASKAKENYSVGLLTNMYPRMLSLINEKKLIPKLEWNQVVDSSVVGFQKPDSGIFETAEKMAGVKPNQIFFVDNSEEHVQAAQDRGWQTMLYDPQSPEESSNQLKMMLGLK